MQKSLLKKPALGFLTFILMQLAIPLIGLIFLQAQSISQCNEPIDMGNLPIGILMLSTSLSGILTILLCIRPIGLIRCPQAFQGEWQSGRRIFLGLVGGIVATVGVAILSELLMLEDLLQQRMQDMTHSTLAWITICIIAPFVEELLMREGIQGHLTRHGVQPIWAIVIASLLFGIVHMNPAQIMAGTMMGIVLGVLYQGAGNVRLCIALHVLNNTISMVQSRFYPESTQGTPLLDSLGGKPMAIVAMLACCLVAVYLLKLFLQRNK